VSTTANTAQREYWNTIAGPRWVGLEGFVERRVQAVNDLLLRPSLIKNQRIASEVTESIHHAPIAPPAAAIRAHCLDCCGGSSDEVRKCTAVRCPSWPFRLGANPWRAPLSEAQRARRRERIARVAKRAGNSPQPEKSRGVDTASRSAPIPAAAAETSEP